MLRPATLMMTKELEAILKKYPRGFYAVSKKEMDEVLDGFEYQMESPGSIAGRLGVSRETLRVWGKKKIIHYFICRDRLFRVTEAYIPLLTLIDAPYPNPEPFHNATERIKAYLESVDKRRKEYYEERARMEKEQTEEVRK